MAQESNWDQASPHAPQGLRDDPYIADCYGYYKSGTIDYSQADCGYRPGQLTDIIKLAQGQTAPASVQQRVAVDYAENSAAAQALTLKWNQLQADGITIDTADPSVIEDWYFTVWAYNSGINPQHRLHTDHCDYPQAQPCAYNSPSDPLQCHRPRKCRRQPPAVRTRLQSLRDPRPDTPNGAAARRLLAMFPRGD